jgi:hypothetical protein
LQASTFRRTSTLKSAGGNLRRGRTRAANLEACGIDYAKKIKDLDDTDQTLKRSAIRWVFSSVTCAGQPSSARWTSERVVSDTAVVCVVSVPEPAHPQGPHKEQRSR